MAKGLKNNTIGETNFHADDTTQDRTFGAALETLDKSLQAVSVGVSRLFFHQGTINQGKYPHPSLPFPINQHNAHPDAAYFNWWSDNQVNAPFYGAYLAALAVSNGDRIVASDQGNDSYAQYVIYRKGSPFKVVLINTDYYSGDGARSETTFKITGLKAQKKLKAVRMTAASSEVYVGQTLRRSGAEPTIAGKFVVN